MKGRLSVPEFAPTTPDCLATCCKTWDRKCLALGENLATFASPSLPLDPLTTYWITAGETASGALAWEATFSTAESSPRSWTIGDQAYVRPNAFGGVWTDHAIGPPNEAGLFSVHATSLLDGGAIVWKGVGGSGNWGSVNNWSPATIPNSEGAHVLFGDGVGIATTVNVGGTWTVGAMTFDNSQEAYLLTSSGGGGGGKLNLVGSATIHIVGPGGYHTLGMQIAGSDGLAKWGIGTLIVDNDANSYSGETRVAQGTLELFGAAPLGNSARVTIAEGAALDVTRIPDFVVPSGRTLSGEGEIYLSLITLEPGSTLRGELTLYGTEIVNSGRLAPGFSPGIVQIFGDYIQEFDGVLEIEVGGLTPGTQHDQLRVSNVAALNGRLEASLINGFHPNVNDVIEFLTADLVIGGFSSLVAPGLPSDLAVSVEFSDTGTQLRFVESSNDILFDAPDAAADWFDDTTWKNVADPGNDRTPIRIDNIELTGRLAAGQRIDLFGGEPAVNRLSVGGGERSIVLGIGDGEAGSARLEATAGASVRRPGRHRARRGHALHRQSSSGRRRNAERQRRHRRRPDRRNRRRGRGSA